MKNTAVVLISTASILVSTQAYAQYSQEDWEMMEANSKITQVYIGEAYKSCMATMVAIRSSLKSAKEEKCRNLRKPRGSEEPKSIIVTFYNGSASPGGYTPPQPIPSQLTLESLKASAISQGGECLFAVKLQRPKCTKGAVVQDEYGFVKSGTVKGELGYIMYPGKKKIPRDSNIYTNSSDSNGTTTGTATTSGGNTTGGDATASGGASKLHKRHSR